MLPALLTCLHTAPFSNPFPRTWPLVSQENVEEGDVFIVRYDLVQHMIVTDRSLALM